MSTPKVAKPTNGSVHPVEVGVHLSRRVRRLLGDTGAVAKKLPHLATAAAEAATKLWESCDDTQVIVWLDNWYRKRFGSDPRHNDMSLNVSVVAVLHIPDIPLFPGYFSLREIASRISVIAIQLSKVATRINSGVATVNSDDLQCDWIRVPLDVHRTGMRSLQWTPYLLTEYTVSSQCDLLQILDDLDSLQQHTKRVLPLLVDMDIHYRVMKLIYGVSTSSFDMGKKLSLRPVMYGV